MQQQEEDCEPGSWREGGRRWPALTSFQWSKVGESRELDFPGWLVLWTVLKHYVKCGVSIASLSPSCPDLLSAEQPFSKYSATGTFLDWLGTLFDRSVTLLDRSGILNKLVGQLIRLIRNLAWLIKHLRWTDLASCLTDRVPQLDWSPHTLDLNGWEKISFLINIVKRSLLWLYRLLQVNRTAVPCGNCQDR